MEGGVFEAIRPFFAQYAVRRADEILVRLAVGHFRAGAAGLRENPPARATQ